MNQRGNLGLGILNLNARVIQRPGGVLLSFYRDGNPLSCGSIILNDWDDAKTFVGVFGITLTEEKS